MWSAPGKPVRFGVAFIAKAVYHLPTTRDLISELDGNLQLRRLYGCVHRSELPHESTFSRAFAEFSWTELPQKRHEAIVRATQNERLIGHISRDSTAIHARERFPDRPRGPREKEENAKAKKKAKRKKKTALRPKQQKVTERGSVADRPRHMTLPAMVAELSRKCAIGAKKGSQGNLQYWRGFKLHTDVADGQIPISAILTGANVSDVHCRDPIDDDDSNARNLVIRFDGLGLRR
jgi:hypothetical protein